MDSKGTRMETGKQIKNKKDLYDNQRQRRGQPELKPGMERRGKDRSTLVECVGYWRGRNEKIPLG